MLRRWGLRVILALVTLVILAEAVLQATLATLAPGTAAWALPLRVSLLGRPLQADVGVATLLRLATHPLAAWVVGGRHVDTAHGRWQIDSRTPGRLDASCAPCRFTLAALGPAPLAIDRAHLSISAGGADQYHGTLRLGDAPQTLTLAWQARFDRAGRMQLDATLPATPLHTAVQVFGSAMPERASVQVQGTLALTLTARLPDGPVRVQPRLEGFAVLGLGTESLLDLQRPAACRDGSDAGVPTVTGWLPRAVVAAEDQRFFDHPGYDPSALADAWQHNQQAGAALVGASTLTQQLAKRLFTGDDRSAARKLRELLYAVEMERTLGKARILQLYLALAPWGQGVCGAERAARVHLGLRSASNAGPVAAAWLASLLPQPDALLRAEQQRGQVEPERVARVLEAMRPMSTAQREKAQLALLFWSPPALAAPPQREAESPAAVATP